MNGKKPKYVTKSKIAQTLFLFPVPCSLFPLPLPQRQFSMLTYLDGIEIVFDNHHPQGVAKVEWLANFQFFGKIHLGQELIVIEENF